MFRRLFTVAKNLKSNAVATLHVMAALRGGYPGQHVEIFHLALDGRVVPRPWSKGKTATSRAFNSGGMVIDALVQDIPHFMLE